MADDEISVEMAMSHKPAVAPRTKAVGSWTCRCGCLTFGPFRGTGVPSIFVKCPHCYDAAEVLVLPSEDADV